MALASPVIIGPVSPCNKSVRVQCQIPGAKVEVFAVKLGQNQITLRMVASGKVDSADAFIDLSSGIQLEPGERLNAQQWHLSDFGPPLAAELAVEVMAKPRSEDLIGLYCSETLLDCATCLWVDGVYPGATVSLTINADPPLVAETQTSSVKFVLPAGDRLHGTALQTDSLSVRQTACGLPGSEVALAKPLVRCHSLLHLTDVKPGAYVMVEHNGDEMRACFGRGRGTFRLPRRLELGDTIRLRQEFPLCELVSRSEDHKVENDLPPEPSIIGLVCEGDRTLNVTGLLDDALVEVEVDGERPGPTSGATSKRHSSGFGWSA